MFKKTTAERPWGSNSALDPSIWLAQGGESAVGGRFVETGWVGGTYRMSCSYVSLSFSTPPSPLLADTSWVESSRRGRDDDSLDPNSLKLAPIARTLSTMLAPE